uniref:Evolutionarily conserved signaling intermediate in Toll pathway, mitochondrial n=1 Tax=Neogobius melanostomus TaxID=47308 RepID=A0A8C6TNU5_9GOBI
NTLKMMCGTVHITSAGGGNICSTRIYPAFQHGGSRHFHHSRSFLRGRPTAPVEFVEDKEKDKQKSLIQDDLFERVAKKNKTKATFNRVVDVFIKQDVRRRGHVDFIYAALQKMPEFGVERDITVYNKLLDVFPKEVFVPRNFIQRMYNHYPRQQECGVQVLEQMETYGVMPNVETKVLLMQIFGTKGHPVRKYQRLLYWFPKFKHDPVDLAKFSLKRIADDLDAKITVYQVKMRHSSQSPSQMELLAKHNPNRPIFVEGPFPLWLRKTCVYYYILRAEPTPPEEKVEEPYDPERCFDYPLQLDLDLDRDFGDVEAFDVEDLDEGPVFAMCMASQGDQATLNQWISSLQETNPMLGQVPTLFRLDSGSRELQVSPDSQPGQDQEQQEFKQESKQEPEQHTAAEEAEEEPQRSHTMKL